MYLISVLFDLLLVVLMGWVTYQQYKRGDKLWTLVSAICFLINLRTLYYALW